MGTTRTYQAVLARIEADLASGQLGIGGRLPGERILADRYGVSRSSVREAIRVLEAMGLIRTGVGSGPDAGAVVTADPAAPIGAALRWHLASRHLPVGDVVGARVLIESWAVSRAAELGSDLSAAEELLDRMDAPELTPVQFLECDTRFHLALAQSADNAVIAAVMTAMRTAIEDYVSAGIRGLSDWPAMARRLRTEHRQILQAVRSGDGPAAQAAITAHINGFYASTGVGAGS